MKIDKNKKEDKIKEIEQFLEELEGVLPQDLKIYKNDFKIRDICERHFEKTVEAVVDLAFITIREKNLKSPEEDKQSFEILASSNIISGKLSKKLQEAKGIRNIIAHEYGKINDELVFEAVTEKLIPDIREFLNNIKSYK